MEKQRTNQNKTWNTFTQEKICLLFTGLRKIVMSEVWFLRLFLFLSYSLLQVKRPDPYFHELPPQTIPVRIDHAMLQLKATPKSQWLNQHESLLHNPGLQVLSGTSLRLLHLSLRVPHSLQQRKRALESQRLELAIKCLSREATAIFQPKGQN